jgi:hypothetical protein
MVDGHEADADAILTQLTLTTAQEQGLDTVVLISGDGGFVSLIEALKAHCNVMVPYIRVSLPSTPDRVALRLGVSGDLRTSATWSPLWTDLLQTGVEDSSYIGHFPFVEALDKQPARLEPNGYRFGVINRWDGDFGFLTDRRGHRWHVGGRALPNGVRDLRVGDVVHFTGAPGCEPGRKYPNVRKIGSIN